MAFNIAFQDAASTHRPCPCYTYLSLTAWAESLHGRSLSFVHTGEPADYTLGPFGPAHQVTFTMYETCRNSVALI